MTTSKLYVTVKIKYPRLMLWINAPLVIFGFKPIAPSWMLSVSDVHGEWTGP